MSEASRYAQGLRRNPSLKKRIFKKTMQPPEHLIIACNRPQTPQRNIDTTPTIVMQSEPRPAKRPLELTRAMAFSEALDDSLEVPSELATPIGSSPTTPTSSRTPRPKHRRRLQSSEFSIWSEGTPSPSTHSGASPTPIRSPLQRNPSSNSFRPSILKRQFPFQPDAERMIRPTIATSHVSFSLIGKLPRSNTVHSTIREDAATPIAPTEEPSRILSDTGFPWGTFKMLPTTPDLPPPGRRRSLLGKFKLNPIFPEGKDESTAGQEPGQRLRVVDEPVKNNWFSRLFGAFGMRQDPGQAPSRRASVKSVGHGTNSHSTEKKSVSPLRGTSSSLLRLGRTFSPMPANEVKKGCSMGGGDSESKMLGTEALSFLRTEMIRVNTPPLRDLDIDGKKRGFFFDISKPPAEVTEGERLLRAKRRKESVNINVLTGPPTTSPKDEVVGKPGLLQRRTNSSQTTSKAASSVVSSGQTSTNRSPETPDYLRQRLATLVDTPEVASDETLVMDVPEHLPNSPLCPLHPKYTDRGGGRALCPMHGKGKRMLARQTGIGRSMLDGV